MVRAGMAVWVMAIVGWMVLAMAPAAWAATSVEYLRVEYMPTPLGIDVRAPRFSWRMKAEEGQRDCQQAAYRIVVSEPAGGVAWDSGRVEGGESLGITYRGQPLQAATRYAWTVTLWDQDGATAAGASWFETGLLNADPALGAWEGAQWIGGGSEDLVFYAPYLPTFNLKYAVAIAPGSTRAGFVYGANDSRLMDRHKNIHQLENGRNRSYIKVELDVSGVDGTDGGRARLHVYRVGYAPGDAADRPVRSYEINPQVIDNANKNGEHVIAIRSELGQISVTVDGSTPTPAAAGGAAGAARGGRGGALNLNPMGAGGDYITFGMLCDMGFAVDAGQTARYSGIEVAHARSPGNVSFRENLEGAVYEGIYRAAAADRNSGLRIEGGAYVVNGGPSGAFVVADPSRNAMPLLRARFAVADKPIAGARLYVTARGIYEMYLNGRRVGDDHYNPGLTQYNRTHLYQTYDVTGLVAAGANALGAALGEGWWSGQLSFGTVWNHFGDRQSLLAKLVITYADGTRDVVTTHPRDWRYFSGGPVLYGSLNMGEVYDARREAAVRDWSTAAYDDRAWKPAVAVGLEGTIYTGGGMNYDRMTLVGQIGGNAGVYATLNAQSVKEVRPGVYVYDLGQNIVGVPRIAIANGRAGGRVTLRFSEMLYPDLPASGRNVGMIMTENYRAALSQDVYLMREGPQVYQPRFTSHGFQYIEITGIDAPLPLEAVQGVAISSIRELAAHYETSNPRVNRLWSNLVWSNVDNFLSIPTDCPQRNERMGWSGDISVFSRTATYVSDAGPFLRRHLLAMRDVQTPQGRFPDIAPVGGGFGGLLWGSAGMTVAWEAYLQYRDVALLEEHYGALAAYINYLQTTLNAQSGMTSDGQLGDWLGPQNNQLSSAFLTTAYHVYNLEIMARAADVLNKKEDVDKYRAMYEERKAFFNRTFVNADKKTVSPAGGRGRGGAGAGEFRLADTQTSYAVGLALNAFDAENTPHMARALAAAVERENRDDRGVIRPPYSLMTGFIGTAWISKALSDHGYSALAYRQLQNDQYPSWLYAIDQGATTIWERLNGYTVEDGFGGNNGMNSFNHYSFGAVGQWMMAHSLGIQRDEPGFRKFILRPEPDPTGQMTWARGHYDSPYGRIESGWKVDNGVLTYTAVVPANTTATLHLPAASAAGVREGGMLTDQVKGVTFVRQENGRAVYTLKSGRYAFSSRM